MATDAVTVALQNRDRIQLLINALLVSGDMAAIEKTLPALNKALEAQQDMINRMAGSGLTDDTDSTFTVFDDPDL